ncbi:DnaD domain protein [Cellulosilyticum sp. I15G10I2]|uniref:DnaD domain protein n=1 Tax=Cellulosilyticum sp. I15G10I2 TaxID=1892843 RepID=UPI00085BB508|nr:DnaD domain protein [Cellulosilyticum sp. I15G10I2]
MAYIKFLTQAPTFVHLPHWFITDYMPKSLGGYLKVYIYLFAQSNSPAQPALSLESVAHTLDMLYSEVIQALKYWDKEGVLHFKELSDKQFELDFYLEKPKTVPKETAPKLPLSKTIISQSRPEYRTEEINLYMQDSTSVNELFKIAEQYLGRLLTNTDQKILYSFYDWLHMPFDLIEFLIEYCASNNHTAIHYIEKVAISWVDEGINTVEQAKEKVTLDKRYFKILSALGSSKSTITLAEKKCITRWLTEYQFSLDVILEACKRTVMQTNKPSLNYVDSILISWYDAKVKTLDDVILIDKAYESKKQLSSENKHSSKRPQKMTKFNDIYSHNWNFEELEKLESEYIERKLNGGN